MHDSRQLAEFVDLKVPCLFEGASREPPALAEHVLPQPTYVGASGQGAVQHDQRSWGIDSALLRSVVVV